jgi:hypothetical protein
MAENRIRTDRLRRLPTSLAKMRRAEQKWRASGSRWALLRVLGSVFELYRMLRSLELARAGAKRIAELSEIRYRPRQHPLRTIIDAVTRADRRTKSRWTRALRFAWQVRRTYDSLEECFEANGGIAGCADKWATLRAEERTPAGYVRVGGEHRVPKIPFFVGVELLSPNGYYMDEKLR